MSESVVGVASLAGARVVSTANSDRNRQLQVGLQLALNQVNGWIQADGDLQQLDRAFGSSWDRKLGWQLIQSWSKGEQLPEIEIVAASQINGANGAFDSTNNRIYVSEQILDQSSFVSAVILEELGHYFDLRVNLSDSDGDEGAIFSRLIQGQQISNTELVSLKRENDLTQIEMNGTVHNLELSTTYGNITIDGSLADWTANDRLDSAANGTAQTGYELYGKYNANNYLFAIKSAQKIGTSTTVWLNTDQNQATGYQVFGFAGGAEYNINFAADGKAYLYNGADGQNYLAPLDYSISADGFTAEIAVSTSLLGTTLPTAIDLLADINNQIFLPGDYSNPTKLTVSQAGNSNPTVVPKSTYGNINLNGNLADWTAIDRLDIFASQQVSGYQVYGKNTADGYVFAINSTTSEAIGANTTIWLNTDGNKATGYQVFGSTVGAEYNINIAADGTPYLYGGVAGKTLIGAVDFARSSDGKTLEVAIPKASMIANGTGIEAYIDINDRVFLPGDYASNSLSVSSTSLPTRTNFSKRIAIVYSETSANKFFDKKAYNQLFTTAQNAAIAAGVPFDLLKESDLKDLSKIINYDALIIPSFTNVNKADLSSIESTLTQAVTKYGMGIVTSGDFMTNDETGAALAGDPYSRMKNLLGIERTAGGGVLNAVITAKDVNNNILSPGYTTGEELVRYDTGTAFAAYKAIGTTGKILAEQTVNGATYNAIVATKTGGQNVHFANQSIFADSNIASQAIESIVYQDRAHVSLDLTRNTSLFLSRNDADLSKFSDVAPRVENKLGDILTEWKSNYGFVGSHYINIGIDATTVAGQSLIATSCPYCLALQEAGSPEGTNWATMKPIYQRWIALGNEIGTHSYNHPQDINNLTPAQLQFEFEGSKLEINRQLGINISGAATPGNPENLAVDQQLDQYFNYITGVGSAYKNAFGFLDPDAKAVYFAPNVSFDFNLIDFRKLTTAQADLEWTKEYNQLRSHAHKPIIEFAWHEYGVVEEEAGYKRSIYENFIARAFKDGTEFVTLNDAQNRIRAFQKSQVTVNQTGDTITAQVTPDNSTTGVGKFSLDIQSTNQIKNVGSYYAFDKDSVFLTKTGGNFTINLGTTADNVTHIVSLAQRAELLSVSGDGQNIEYTFNGEGKISIDLNLPTGRGFTTTGADSYTLIGNRLEMVFNQFGTYAAKVNIGDNPNYNSRFGGTTTNISQGYAGNDTLTAGNQNHLVIGGTGNDILTGGSGRDVLVGVDPNSTTAGRGEIDILTHSGQGDRFILGDTNRVYYNDGNSLDRGLNDYAKIVGFSATAGDVIQLKGRAGDYSLRTPPTGLGTGTAIYNNLFGQRELIGIVQNGSGLNLTASYFNYV
jgi:peptidoglycan/xylan/chitin deacetylase (PgdA/CDA1 family)